jgi:WD40 repeat protein
MTTKKSLLLILILLLAGCTADLNKPVSSNSYLELPATLTPETNPLRSPTSTLYVIQTRTIWPTLTPSATPTLFATPQSYLGTPVPSSALPIGEDNISQLELVGQWGKGPLEAVAFSPNGKTFAAASFYGVAIYYTDALTEAPTWVPFETYNQFDQIVYNSDGDYLAFLGDNPNYLELETQLFIEDSDFIEGIPPKARISVTNGTTAVSPDGSREFRGGLGYIYSSEFYDLYGYERHTEEIVYKEVYDTSTGDLIYELPDDPIYITIEERMEPESCDMVFWSPCGNAWMDLVIAPSKAEFSPDGNLLAVLYHAFSLGTDAYNTLRLYDADTGELLSIIGSYEDPVKDFSFSPDSNSILVGFVDGSLQKWDLEEKEATYGAQHFNSDIRGFSFSADGRFILVLRDRRLEVRSLQDGSLVASYSASTYALSPDGESVAIGDWDGMIRLRNIASGEVIRRYQGHTGKIFALAFSEDGLYLVSSSEDCSVRLWNARTGEYQRTMEVTEVDYYEGIATDVRIFIWHLEFLPESPLVMGFGSFGTAVTWDRYSGQSHLVIESAPLDYYQGMVTVAPHYPGSFGVDLENDRFFIGELVYDLETGSEIGKYNFEEEETQPEDCYPYGPISIDRKLRFTKGRGELVGKICILDNQTMELVRTVQVMPKLGYGYSYVAWPFLSPDGTQLIVPTYDGLLFVYQIDN